MDQISERKEKEIRTTYIRGAGKEGKIASKD